MMINAATGGFRIGQQTFDPSLSESEEDEIKLFHDKWLKEQLGDPPYQYAWGRVMSIIEPHW